MSTERQILERAIKLFDGVNSMVTDRYRRKLVDLIADETFLRAIFRPTPRNDTTKEEMRSLIMQVYDAASKRSSVAALADAISDYGYSYLSRTSAVFLVSLVNLGMATIDNKAADIGRARDHNEVSAREYERVIRKLDDYQEDLNTLLKYARRIVKGKARELAAKTGLPKEICISALFSVPAKQYLDTYKVGFYLQALLSNLYGYVNLTANEPWVERGMDAIDWEFFFVAIFTRDRAPDVASLILLEGVNRIENYQNYDVVKECWDAITVFALKTLNKAPSSVRDQMLELYLKRINKMLADHSIDLRIDLRMIDDFRFKNLADTISRYKKKIDAILDSAPNMANARPDSVPV